jgi:RNA polymerase sigma-70 factor (ECF subfamily)
MSTRQEIDLQLLQEAKKGNQDAYYKLFKHYHSTIHFYVWSMIKNHEDAKDLTMISFEKAFLNLNRYTPTALFSTWLNKIAKHTVVDFIRIKHLDKYSFFDIEEPSTIIHNYNEFSAISNPEDELIYKELSEQVDIALAALPSPFKEVIDMRYGEDLLCREIADKQNVTIGVVTGQIRYARKYLNQALTEKEVL